MTDLEAEPCEIRPAAGVLGATEPALNRDKDLAAEGGSPEKIAGMEEDSSMGPLPERVTSLNLILFFSLSFIILELFTSFVGVWFAIYAN